MEIKVNRINSANATAEAVVANKIVDEKIDTLAKQAAKNMKIDGFRKGKIPTSVVKKRYGKELSGDAEQEVLRDVVSSAMEQLELTSENLIGEPQVSKLERGDEALDIEIKIGLAPEIDAEKVKSLVPEFEEVVIADEDVEERLKELAESSAPFEDVTEERGLEDGDYAVVDFEGFIDGEAMENGSAQDYNLKIGSNSFIPGFEEQLKGMKAGEEKEIEVTFPEEYGSAEIAGKPAVFKVKLKGIKKKAEQPLDDALAKKLLPEDEDANIATVREKIKEQLKSEETTKLYNDELKPKLLESFAGEIEFDLPDFVVEQEMDIAFRNRIQQLSAEEIEKLQQSQEEVSKMREEHRDDAVKSVKVTFIVDSLARKEGIDVNENELMQQIYYESMQMGKDPKEMLKLYQERGLLPAIKMSMVEDKLLSHLLDSKLKKEEA